MLGNAPLPHCRFFLHTVSQIRLVSKLLRHGVQVTKKELLLVMHRKNLVEHALVPPIRTGPGIRQSHPDDAILAKMYFKQEK